MCEGFIPWYSLVRGCEKSMRSVCVALVPLLPPLALEVALGCTWTEL